MQCLYYLHSAEARARASTTGRPVSSRPRPAAGSAARRSSRRSSACTRRSSRKAQRPVRMIYDRHEDIAATTKRHPAIVRHRTGIDPRRPPRGPGHRGRHGRRRVLHAHPGRALARPHSTRRALPLPERADPSAARRGRTPAPNGAFRGFGAPQTHFANGDAHEPVAAIGTGPDRAPAAERLSADGDETATGQVIRRQRRPRGGPRTGRGAAELRLGPDTADEGSGAHERLARRPGSARHRAWPVHTAPGSRGAARSSSRRVATSS